MTIQQKLKQFFTDIAKDADFPKEVRDNLQNQLAQGDVFSAKDAIFTTASIVRQGGEHSFTMAQTHALLLADSQLSRLLA